jgi:hypothetical protein
LRPRRRSPASISRKGFTKRRIISKPQDFPDEIRLIAGIEKTPAGADPVFVFD